MTIARVAIDVPVDTLFDFRVPETMAARVGSLVIVPFGRTRKVGVVVALQAGSAVAANRLRDVEAIVEDVAPLGAIELELLAFCARYYVRPLGEVAATALPPRLRQVARRPLALPRASLARASDTAPAPDPSPASSQCCCRASREAARPRCTCVRSTR